MDGTLVATAPALETTLVSGVGGFYAAGTGYFDNATMTTACDGGFQCYCKSLETDVGAGRVGVHVCVRVCARA